MYIIGVESVTMDHIPAAIALNMLNSGTLSHYTVYRQPRGIIARLICLNQQSLLAYFVKDHQVIKVLSNKVKP